MAASLVQKLAFREQCGSIRCSRKSLPQKPFYKIPGRLCYRLSSLVPQFVLEEGHVFLGFTKSGQFVVSYSLHVDADEHTAYPMYIYKLQWWKFVPTKSLELVSEVRLFGEEDIVQDLFIAFCEWPEDDTKVLVYGHCAPSRGEDSCHCYLSVMAVPCLTVCKDCQLLRKETSGNVGRCLQHSFCVHTKYELAPPFPAFSPRVQLKVNGIAILNTGDSIVALQIDAKQKHSYFNQNGQPQDLEPGEEEVPFSCPDNMFYIGAELFLVSTKASYCNIEESSSPVCHENGDGKVKEFLENMQEVTVDDDDDEENVCSPDLDHFDIECQECDKSAKNCDNSCHCRSGLTRRPALKVKNCSTDSNTNSDCGKNINNCSKPFIHGGSLSPGCNSSHGNQYPYSFSNFPDLKLHSPDLSGCTSANQPSDFTNDDFVTNCSSSRLSSQRSFFSPSNSYASSTGSKSSESVMVHTNHSRTVTFSLRRYSYSTEDMLEPPIVVEDDYDLAYRSVLPVEVLWSNQPLSIVLSECNSGGPTATVLQMTFDIEHYMVEVIHQEAEWGQRYVAFCNYDLQILDVCPESAKVYGTVHALIQAREKSLKQSKGVVKSYQTNFTFEWDLRAGSYSTLHIDELVEVNEQILRGRDWKPGSKECNQLRRKMVWPQSFFRSVHVLSNEAVFKGRSLSMLIAPNHYTAILL